MELFYVLIYVIIQQKKYIYYIERADRFIARFIRVQWCICDKYQYVKVIMYRR